MLNRIILKSPIITEKSLKDAENGEYTFLVDTKSNKIEIKKAVENEFKVNAVWVKTITTKGKTKRVGKKRMEIEKEPKKKAIIKLKKDQKIDLFEAGGK